MKPGIEALMNLVGSDLADTNRDEYRKQLKAIADNKENIPDVRKAALKMWNRTLWPRKAPGVAVLKKRGVRVTSEMVHKMEEEN